MSTRALITALVTLRTTITLIIIRRLASAASAQLPSKSISVLVEYTLRTAIVRVAAVVTILTTALLNAVATYANSLFRLHLSLRARLFFLLSRTIILTLYTSAFTMSIRIAKRSVFTISALLTSLRKLLINI